MFDENHPTTGTIDNHAWMNRGACAEIGPSDDIWFCEEGREEPVEQARGICYGSESVLPCPVLTICLEYALARPALSGIWAGTTKRQRSRIRRVRRDETTCRTCDAEYTAHAPNARYCSPACRLEGRRRGKDGQKRLAGLP